MRKAPRAPTRSLSYSLARSLPPSLSDHRRNIDQHLTLREAAGVKAFKETAMVVERPPQSKVTEERSEDASALRTVFVRNLPYTFTDSQLQEVFSEIGPVRRSFTVKESGSEHCRGFGYVQFAIAGDAIRAVEEKDGTDLQGRKIMVKPANRRPSLEKRRTKDGTTIKGDLENVGATEEGSLASKTKEEGKLAEIAQKEQDREHGSRKHEKATSRKVEKKKLKDGKLNGKGDGADIQGKEKRPRDVTDSGGKRQKKKKVEAPSEAKSSEKQKVARTVVLGGLVSPEMREDVIESAKKVGEVDSIQTSLSPQELKGRGLEKDGCRVGAAAVVYRSVRAASQAVAKLHGKSIAGGTIWARQLGGEGSKPKKWRVIIRNLPFSITEEKVRDLFATVGFVWEVKVPRKGDGKARGFSFASFLSKAIAEKAICVMNGKMVEKRPIAVDWAVEKCVYESTISAEMTSDQTTTLPSKKTDDKTENSSLDIEDEETASEDEEGNNEIELDFPHESEVEDKDGNEETSSFDEVDLAKRVLNKVVSGSFSKEPTSKPAEMDVQDRDKWSVSPTNEGGDEPDKGLCTTQPGSRGDEPDKGLCTTQPGSRGDLNKTIFVKNLPFDVDTATLKKQFSAFGRVKSTFLVLHPKTKRPKGSAFLEFVAVESAEAALAAATLTRDNTKFPSGIMLGGRQLEVLKAMEKKSAEAKEKEKLEQAVVDRRNLYLLKEGIIEEGTPAASAVSEEDIQKRQQLEKVKAIKLKSPNFHVSKTRLAVYNVPKSMKETAIRKLFIDAVKSRATKQSPTIKQVKILKDEAKGDKSRGVAFVEFSEHQHALVALRMLNNNPETFGPQRRPIVGFAIENLQTLRKRKERQLEAVRKSVGGSSDDIIKKPKQGGGEKSKARKRKEALGNESQLPTIEAIDERVREGLRVQGPNAKGGKWTKRTKPTSIHNEELGPSKKGKRSADRNPSFNGDPNSMHEVPASKRQKLAKEWSGREKKTERLVRGENKGGKRKNVDGGANQNIYAKGSQNIVQSILKEAKAGRRKDKGANLEVEDKLEKLVAVYRDKYFSDASRSRKDAGGASRDRKAPSDLKRWFE